VTPRTAPEFDVSNPHPARVYDFLLGGRDNYAADRAAARAILRAAPGAACSAQANRAFLGRAVRYLAGAGIRQFLDIGTGIPAPGSTHETAQAAAPESRVAYVDFDPVVLAHARALFDSSEAGDVGFIEADLRDPDKVIAGAGDYLDFTKPVALLLVAVLHFVPGEDDPAGLVAAYRDALPPGSFLALSHGTTDFRGPEVNNAIMAALARGPSPLTLRPRPAIEAYFDGFTLLPPGLVQPHRWRPDAGQAPDAPAKTGIYAGVAAKTPLLPGEP
jgi:SAM-dependent methyltransferase